jgi:hypothetical protein
MSTENYDADGKQIKATINGTTTVYIGGHYEIKDSVVSKYRCNDAEPRFLAFGGKRGSFACRK